MNFLPLACATCASNFQDDGANPAGWSIFVMFVIIMLVLGGVTFFMARIIRSSSQLPPELCDDYVSPEAMR